MRNTFLKLKYDEILQEIVWFLIKNGACFVGIANEYCTQGRIFVTKIEYRYFGLLIEHDNRKA